MRKSELTLALTGNLKRENEKTKLAFLIGNKAAVERAGITGKNRLREDVLKAGMSQRLANTWRYNVYPGGKRLAHEPASILYTRAPKIILAHADATLITTRNRKYLAIPTDAVPKGGRDAQGRFRGRYSPEEVENRYNRDLIFVEAKSNGNAFLLMDKSQPRSPKAKRRRRRTAKRKLVLMFTLVRQVHLRKRLNPQAIIEQLTRDWPDIHMAALNAHLGIALR